jgi:hypothetical protein
MLTSIFMGTRYRRGARGSVDSCGAMLQTGFLLIHLILPAALGSGLFSASNRNEYQKHINNNVSGE